MLKKQNEKKAAKNELNEIKILSAAVACIRKYGAAKTTMEDVAAEAAVGRQTIYRSFRSRTEMFDAVALQRLTAMQPQMKKFVNSYPSLESAIIHATIDIRSFARKDRIFMSVVDAAGDHGLERYLLHPTSVIRDIMSTIWADMFERARTRGELRPDLSDIEISDWLRFVNFTLLVREDLAVAEQKAWLKKFVLPALAVG